MTTKKEKKSLEGFHVIFFSKYQLAVGSQLYE